MYPETFHTYQFICVARRSPSKFDGFNNYISVVNTTSLARLPKFSSQLIRLHPIVGTVIAQIQSLLVTVNNCLCLVSVTVTVAVTVTVTSTVTYILCLSVGNVVTGRSPSALARWSLFVPPFRPQPSNEQHQHQHQYRQTRNSIRHPITPDPTRHYTIHNTTYSYRHSDPAPCRHHPAPATNGISAMLKTHTSAPDQI
ncbi:hypothetical protein FHL15_011296 [Xylaria flabelliformis]|uniref:Uncharacterized protein n=1 Tax=Xylaria flabelliformis TaxID=2512241 RepID=A0A553HIR1_9PEZI|nr:hypothetical protein FHL15_011296 [Xylaria flabelliformis]